MNETKYQVIMTGEVMAHDMTIDTALVLIEALTEKYYKEMGFGGEITLREEGNEIKND